MTRRVLYFDCFAGAAGDMILGALIDAGAPVSGILETLHALNLAGWELHVSRVDRGGRSATKIDVDLSMRNVRRTYPEIVAILGRADLPERVRDRAEKIFRILAEAEATVHRQPIDEVHLHEVGALDAIVDIVGTSAALEHFAPDVIVTSPIATGRGSTLSEHGVLPLPAPAVVEILKATDARLFERGEHELITPTGAAILAAITDEFAEDAPPLAELSSGYGAGARETEVPNAVRVIVGTAQGAERTESAPTPVLHEPQPQVRTLVIETNIDDMSPELLPHVLDALLGAGAQDAWLTPIIMKKGRPAYTLSVLLNEDDKERLVDVIYRETTTLGLRVTEVEKDELVREWVEVSVGGHPLRVKVGRRGTSVVTIAPEHADAVKVARATGRALKDIYAQATTAADVLLKQRLG